MKQPKILAPTAEETPDVMRAEPRWIVWRLEWKPKLNRWNKTPYNVNNGRWASTTDPQTWAPFDLVWRAYQNSMVSIQVSASYWAMAGRVWTATGRLHSAQHQLRLTAFK
jgi:hypothetical protein